MNYLIPIQDVEKTFSDFMDGEPKEKIFFSGKFGIGKTFFLRQYFETNKDKFETFHLFPINYQINSNEDIIKLLKYDILIELLNKPDFKFEESNNKKDIKLFFSFLQEKKSINGFLTSVLSYIEDGASLSGNPAVSVIGKLGRPLKDILVLDKEFQEYKKENQDEEIINDFLQTVAKDNSITDYVSYFIKNTIQEFKKEKKSVLILDDIDRIDPEHLFRILNIFSAHFEDNESNKFGFDHVVIVGDIKNIKSIFEHKYGKGADFDGYFNKFFSAKPFYLNNKNVIIEHIPKLLKQIKSEDDLKQAMGESGYIQLFLSQVLIQAFSLNEINLRQIYAPINYSFQEVKNTRYEKNPFHNSFVNLIDISVDLLIAIYAGDEEKLISSLEKIKNNPKEEDIFNERLFNAYSSAIVSQFKEFKVGIPETWGEYQLEVESVQQGRSSILVRLNDNNAFLYKKFFYDVLIQYIKDQKFKKKKSWYYQ